MPPRKKPSVCHITFSEFPADGRVRRYVNALVENGIFVNVICIQDTFNPPIEEKENLRIHRLGVPKKRGSYLSRTFEYIVFFFRASFAAFRSFRKYKTKIFHTHTLPDFISLAAFFPRLLGAKVILDFHEFTPEILMLRKNLPEKNWLIRFSKIVEKISASSADELITIHEGVALLIGKRVKRTLMIIINGVEENEFRGFTKSPTDDFNIVYNGTINDTINLEDVVYALGLLRNKVSAEEFSKIKFLLYGSGPVLNFILSEADRMGLRDTVIYKGRVSHVQITEELKKMSICILPLHKNLPTDLSYPIKIPELINMGIPIIISRLETMQRYYSEDAFFYFDAGDVNSLSEIILRIKRNPSIVKAKIENALKDYQKISWESVMRPRYLELVNKLLI